MRLIQKVVVGLLIAMIPLFASAQTEPPQFVTVDGRLYDSTNPTNPLLDGNVAMRIQVLNPAKTCILYEEQQSVSTLANGYFNARVGSPTSGMDSLKRTGLDSGNPMSLVFQNQNAPITGLTSGGLGCSYTPSPGESRFFRFIVTPSTTGVTSTLSPDMTIDSVPQSLVAETLQGFASDDFLQINANVTQAKANTLFGGSYAALTSLIAGTSSLYLQNTTNGTVIPSSPANPGTLTPGQIWYDSTTNELKYYNGGSVQTVGTGTGLDATKLPLAGGTMTGAIDMGSNNILNAGSITQSAQRSFRFGGYDAGQQATYLGLLAPGHQGTTWYNVDTDRLMYWDGTGVQEVLTASSANSLVPDCNADESLQMSPGPLYVWSCVPTTDSTKLALAGGAMTGALTMNAQNQVRYADADSSNFAAIQSPAVIGANYVLTLPVDDGTPGQVLQTDGNGILSWLTIPSAPVTTVFGRSGAVVAQASDYDANQIDNTPAGGIAATDVQAALNELDTEKAVNTRNINTNANSGLAGGGNLSADRNLSVDITGTTALGAAADNADEVLIYDASGSVLRKVTRAQLNFSESEVDAFVANNGYAADADKVNRAGDTMTGALNLDNEQEMRFSEADGNGANYVAIKSPNNLGANYSLTLPADDGTPGQVLSTDGNGVLSWIVAGASITPDSLNFTDLADALVLDVSTDISVGTNVLSVTNDGSGNSFVVNDNGSGDTTPFVIDASGNVGVGTTLASTKLHVANSSSTVYVANGTGISPSGSAGSVMVQNLSATDGSGSYLRFSTLNAASTDNTAYIGAISKAADSSPAIVFGSRDVGGVSSYSERMRVDSGGNVGIGTAIPGTLLDVAGTITSRPSGTLAGETGRLVMRELAAAGTDTVAIRAPDALSASYALTLPIDDGTSGQVLSTDGNGILSWIAPGSSISADSLNFIDLADALVLDASTDISVTGTDVLSITNSGTGDSFRVNDVGSDTSPFVIDNAGNVGVGIASPWTDMMLYRTNSSAISSIVSDNTSSTAARYPVLSVKNFAGTTATLGNPGIELVNNRGTSTTSAEMQVGDILGAVTFNGSSDTITSYREGAGIRAYAAENFTPTTSGGILVFSTSSIGSIISTERLRIDAAGNVGIGTTGPGTIIDAAGAITSRPSGTLSGETGKIIMRELAAGGTETATIRAPDALGASYALTLPIDDGTSGQVLSTDGNGVLSWIAAGTSISPDSLNFTDFADALVLDASTDISATGAEVLSITNSGTGNSFVVNDQTADTSPFLIDNSGRVAIGTTAPALPLDVRAPIAVGASGTFARFSNSDKQRMLEFGQSNDASGTRATIQSTSGTANAEAGRTQNALMLNPVGGSVHVGARPSDFPDFAELQLWGPNQVVDSFGNFSIMTTSAQAADRGGQISLGGFVTATPTTLSAFAMISGRKENATINDSTGYLSLATSDIAGIGTEKMRINSLGNVGIGTSLPGTRLDVAGAITSRPSGAGSGQTGQIIMRELAAGGTETATIRAPDALGASYALTLPLDDGTSGQVLSTDGNGILSWIAPGSTISADSLNFTDLADALVLDTSTDISVTGTDVLSVTNSGSGSSFRVNDEAGDTSPFVINNAGFVGIGTSSPQRLLHLQASDVSTPTMIALDNVDTSAFSGASIGWRGTTTGAGAASFQTFSYINSLYTDHNNATKSSAMQFYTSVAGTTDVRMIIDQLGNIGIGNNAPTTQLDVSGSLTSRPHGTATGETGKLILRELAANGTNTATIRSPDALGANYVLTLPVDDGITGQVLQTDGTGILGWVSAPVNGGVFLAGAGSIGVPSISFSGDPNTGFFNPYDGAVSISINGSAKFNVDTNAIYGDGGTGGYRINAFAGSATIPVYHFLNDDDTGLFRAGADILGFSTAGSERMRLDSTGLMGIGTTVPGTRLDVDGAITSRPSGTLSGETGQIIMRELAASGSETATIRAPDALGASYALTLPVDDGTSGQVLSTDGNGILSWIAPGSTISADSLNFTDLADALVLDASTDISVTGTDVLSVTNSGTGSSFRVNDEAGDTTPFVIDPNGWVGVGTATPQDPIHIHVGNSKDGFRLTDNTTGVGLQFQAYYPSINFNQYWDGSNNRKIGTGFSAFINQEPTVGVLRIGVSASGAAGTVASSTAIPIQIRGDGRTEFGANVGFGAANPTSRLQVSSNFSSTSWTTGGAILRVDNSTITDTSGAGAITDRVVSSVGVPTLASSNAVSLTNASTFYIAGAPVAGANTTITNPTALRVASGTSVFGGSVGVGTTSPTTLLDIAGAITSRPSGVATGQTGQIMLRELAAGGSETATIRAPDALGASYALTLPVDDGTSGQVLSTDGNGILSWIAPGGSIAADSLNFTDLADALVLDASTDISVTGTNVLSVTNSGTANSFRVNDEGTDTTPFVIDASGNVGIGTSAPVAQLQLQRAGYASNSLLLQNGVTSAPPAYPGGLLPSFVVQSSQTTGSRPLFFGYDSGGAWAGHMNVGACGSFSSMCLNLASGSGNYTALKNSGANLMIAGGTGSDGNYTDILFGHTGNMAIGTTSANNKLTVMTSVFGDGIKVIGSASPMNSVGDGTATLDFGLASAATNFSAQAQPGDVVVRGAGSAANGRLILSSQNATGGVLITTGTTVMNDTVKVAVTNAGSVGIGTTVPSTLLDIAGAITSRPSGTLTGETGQLMMRELAINGTNTATIRAPDALGSNYVLTLPVDDGTSGQVLQTDGNGLLSWVSPAASLANNSLNFDKLADALVLDASTDIALDGAEILSITNTGTANSFVVNDQFGDTSPFVIDTNGNVGIGTTTASSKLEVNGRIVSSLGTDGDLLTSLTVDFSAANVIDATGASAPCGTLNITNTVSGGSFTLTIPNATATCTTIHWNGSATGVKLPAGYTGGVASAGLVYSFIHSGSLLWVTNVTY